MMPMVNAARDGLHAVIILQDGVEVFSPRRTYYIVARVAPPHLQKLFFE